MLDDSSGLPSEIRITQPTVGQQKYNTTRVDHKMGCLLPEEMLNKLLCSTCHKYLSRGPIKVYRTKIVKCGRCVKQNDYGVESLFNHIVKSYLFPCVNRFEGCNEVLTIDEVVSHEEKCKSGIYNCPYETDAFVGSAFELMLHFQKKHYDNFLGKSEFYITAINEKSHHHMLRQNNFLFIITSTFDFRKLQFRFKCCILGDNLPIIEMIKNVKIVSVTTNDVLAQYVHPELQSKISKELEIKLSEKTFSENVLYKIRFTFKTIYINSNLKYTPNLDIVNHEETNVTDVHLTTPEVKFKGDLDKFKAFMISTCGTKVLNTAKDISISPLCSICNQHITDIIYACKDFKHLACSSCSTIDKCIDGEEYSEVDDNLNIMYLNLRFACKWKCDAYFSGGEIEMHQINCSKSATVNCPVEICNFFGKLGHLETHFIEEHKQYSFNFTAHLSLRTSRHYIMIDDFVVTFYYKKLTGLIKYYYVDKCFSASNKNELYHYRVFVNNTYKNDNHFYVYIFSRIIIKIKHINNYNISIYFQTD